MPAFASTLAGDDIWAVVQFLRALSDTAGWIGAGEGGLVASRVMAAPDFTFELPGQGQQTLTSSDRRRGTLLVVYSLPDSLARLRSLASDWPAFDTRRIEVLAVTSSEADARVALAQIPGGKTMIAISSPDVAAAYAMFTASRGAVDAPRHAEFLIDRDGRIRAQWRGVPGRAGVRNGEIFAEAAKQEGERPAPPPPHGHQH